MKRFKSKGEELEFDSLHLAHLLTSISRNTDNINNNNKFKIFEPKQLKLPSSSNNCSSSSFKILESPTRAHDLSLKQFKCKTCNRQFQSFQALGGHRSSMHKKQRILTNHPGRLCHVGPTTPKIHECPICGLEFRLGQALGAHMSSHRDVGDQIFKFEKIIEFGEKKNKEVIKEEKKLCLDLNLAPPGRE